MLDYDKQEYRKLTGKSERDKYLNVNKKVFLMNTCILNLYPNNLIII